MKGETLGRFPAGKVGQFVLEGKAQGHVHRGEADPGGPGRLLQFPAEKDVRKHALAVPVGVGGDKIPELPRLEAAAAVAHPVRPAGLQTLRRPWGTDVVIFQKGRIPEMEVHREAVHLDMQQKRGGKIVTQLQRLKPLAFLPRAGRDLPPNSRMGHRRAPGGKVHHRPKVDAGTDMVQDAGGEIGVLLGVVDQQGDLR